MRILLLLPFLISCLPEVRKAVKAEVFIADHVPCEAESPVWNYGIYRTVFCKKEDVPSLCDKEGDLYEEYISYCDEAIKEYVSFNRVRLEEILKSGIKKTK